MHFSNVISWGKRREWCIKKLSWSIKSSATKPHWFATFQSIFHRWQLCLSNLEKLKLKKNHPTKHKKLTAVYKQSWNSKPFSDFFSPWFFTTLISHYSNLRTYMKDICSVFEKKRSRRVDVDNIQGVQENIMQSKLTLNTIPIVQFCIDMVKIAFQKNCSSNSNLQNIIVDTL